jgi:hypothetical protein
MSMTVKLTGILTDVFPVEHTTNFAKKVFWLKEPDTSRYPQHWAIQLHNKDTDNLKGINVGDVLECEVEIRGKKFRHGLSEEKIFISLKCIGIRVLDKLEAEQYQPRTKPGRESDSDRQQPQTRLPL